MTKPENDIKALFERVSSDLSAWRDSVQKQFDEFFENLRPTTDPEPNPEQFNGLMLDALRALGQGAQVKSGRTLQKFVKVGPSTFRQEGTGTQFSVEILHNQHAPLFVHTPKADDVLSRHEEVVDRHGYVWRITAREQWRRLKDGVYVTGMDRFLHEYGPFTPAPKEKTQPDELEGLAPGSVVQDAKGGKYVKDEAQYWVQKTNPAFLRTHYGPVTFISEPEPDPTGLSETQLSALPVDTKVQRVHGKQEIFIKIGPNLFYASDGAPLSTTTLFNSFAPLTKIEESKRPHDLRPGSVIKGALPTGGRWFLIIREGKRAWIPQTSAFTRTDDDFADGFTILLEAT